jgi:hypothetical protein
MVVVCFVVAAWYLWRDGKAVGEPEGGESRLVSAGQLSAPVKAAPQPVTGGPVKQVSPKPPEPLQVDLPEEVEPAPAVVAAEPLTLPSQIRVSTNLITRSAVGEQTDGGTEAGGSVEENASWPELRLQSIIFRSEAPMAMISGKTLVAGEKVLGVELLEVRRSSVLLRWQGRTQEMRLPDL